MRNFWTSLKDWFFQGYERVRARDSKGRYVADDKSTPHKNEAYVLRKKNAKE